MSASDIVDNENVELFLERGERLGVGVLAVLVDMTCCGSMLELREARLSRLVLRETFVLLSPLLVRGLALWSSVVRIFGVCAEATSFPR